MLARFARTGLVIATLGLAVGLAGCTDTSVTDFSPQYAHKQLPAKILAAMKAKDMKKSSPIVARIFKEEGVLEIWKQKTNGRYDVIATYPICKWSGQLGPKYTEGDRQAPEGFYEVRPSQMNPRSNYHLAFNIGYPNAYDRANGRTGSNLMVHGACSSSGCYSMTDQQIEEIYAFGRDAFQGGQTEFQIQAYPFRMTAANMARYHNDPNFAFWKMLKVGYDNFEITKVPPKVDVCEKRYVFNQVAAPGSSFSPTGACPASTQPDSLRSAYASYESRYDVAFNAAVKAGTPAPRDSINGIKEANLVSEWSRRRARGERVPITPPSLNTDGSITETNRMGRIDSPAGRKMAAIDAEKAAKEKAAQEKATAIAAAKAAKEAEQLRVAEAKAAAEAAKEQAANPILVVPAVETAQSEGPVGRLKNKLLGMFGG